MSEVKDLKIERHELGRRRRIAKARLERESARKALLSKLIRTERQVVQLRAWIETQEARIVTRPDPALDRMLRWARAQLAALEAVLDPIQLSEVLCARELFPQVDELDDPLGDPPPEQPWGL
jgi:hypothetical protein